MESCEGNVCGTGKWLPPPPPILVGNPEDVAEAQVMLIHAKHYGPQTRQLVETIENSNVKIRLVRNDPNVLVADSSGVVDLGDFDYMRDDLYNPLPPANALLHELVEQYHYQINKRKYPEDYLAVHRLAADAENMANRERYAGCPPGSAPVRDVSQDYWEKNDWGFYTLMQTVYTTTYPEIGGRNTAVLTYDFGKRTWKLEWKK
jgi:hypothetical protein